MITRLMRLIPMWVWLLMAAAIAARAGWLHLQAVTAERNAAMLKAVQAAQRADVTTAALAWQLAQALALSDGMAARDRALADAQADIQASRDALVRLEREDAETSNWSDQSVPVAIVGWVRSLARSSDDTCANEAECSGASARSTASSHGID